MEVLFDRERANRQHRKVVIISSVAGVLLIGLGIAGFRHFHLSANKVTLASSSVPTSSYRPSLNDYSPKVTASSPVNDSSLGSEIAEDQSLAKSEEAQANQDVANAEKLGTEGQSNSSLADSQLEQSEENIQQLESQGQQIQQQIQDSAQNTQNESSEEETCVTNSGASQLGNITQKITSVENQLDRSPTVQLESELQSLQSQYNSILSVAQACY